MRSKSCGTDVMVSLCWREGEENCPYVYGWKCPPSLESVEREDWVLYQKFKDVQKGGRINYE